MTYKYFKENSLAALFLLAGWSLRRRHALLGSLSMKYLQSKYFMTPRGQIAHSHPSNCRFYVESPQMKTLPTPVKPWYREPWPWLLMSGPAIVVVAGIFTAYLAVRTHDGLVVDDYYKQGLTVNKDLSRDTTAKMAGYRAEGIIDASLARVTLTVTGLPPNLQDLTLKLSRATVSGYDRRIQLQRSNQNIFIGALAPLQAGKWYVTLEDEARTWRLLTTFTVNDVGSTVFSLGSTALQPADG